MFCLMKDHPGSFMPGQDARHNGRIVTNCVRRYILCKIIMLPILAFFLKRGGKIQKEAGIGFKNWSERATRICV